ncbi:hypothetical protein EV06_0824 [Prochlorococcus sp. MIT 0602]|nr:hypothetical protein EV06_0824 [Prochlorococcus sp. MIT 0602]KGG17234.1 hypothetical protein EV07_0671 [Prochlorococcus sp. MIT 0603]
MGVVNVSYMHSAGKNLFVAKDLDSNSIVHNLEFQKIIFSPSL